MSTSKEAIHAEVTATLAEMFALDKAKLAPETRLVEDLGLDSIDAIDMAVRLEKRVGFEFKGPDLRSLRTVQDIVELLWNHQHSAVESGANSARPG
ncbi:MAG: acyl carrier protein [Planctomycetes bacterium]|jgi:acyl carrier protein|nr:acyl carrier protein [Planctomycetota bacterium]